MKAFRERAGRAAALLALLVCMLPAAAAGCGGPPAGTPAQILEKCIGAQGGLKSVAVNYEGDFELSLPGGSQTSAILYRGVYEKPDRWKLALRTAGSKTEVIIVGDRTWVKLPGSDAWTEKTSAASMTGNNPDEVVASRYLNSARNVKMIDRKSDSYHLGFDLDIGSFAKAFNLPGVDPGTFKGRKARFEAWVRKKDYYLQKATMEFAGRLATPQVGTFKMSTGIDFKDFNVPVSIEPPKGQP